MLTGTRFHTCSEAHIGMRMHMHAGFYPHTRLGAPAPPAPRPRARPTSQAPVGAVAGWLAGRQELAGAS